MDIKELVILVKQCVDLNDMETLRQLASQLALTVEQLKALTGVKK